MAPSDRAHITPVDTREELIYLLSNASELEHGLACVYLYAAYSLKNDVSEGGLTGAQAEMVRGWRRRLAKVAVEEMLHLAQVSNLLTAVGGAPHFMRPNFPLGSTAFPFGLRLSLEPFSQETIERFVCFEMPEAGVLTPEQEAIYKPIRDRIMALEGRMPGDDSAEGGAPLAEPTIGGVSVAPFAIDFKTVGEFYHKIQTGFETMAEDELFIGPPEVQANARFVDLGGELVAVVDRASAVAAITMIIEQGEAPSTAHPDAHFSVFDTIRLEYEAERAAAYRDGSVFQPVRRLASNPMTRFFDDAAGGTIIVDPTTHELADLFNISYDTMLLMLIRFFAHTDETDGELERLSRATLRLMTTVIRPLAEALCMMPIGGPAAEDQMAGPGFGYNRDVHLLPHKRSAWIFFGERLRQIALVAVRLSSRPGVPPMVGEAASALEDLAEAFAPTGRKWSAATEQAEFQAAEQFRGSVIVPSLNGPYLVTNVRSLQNSRGEALPARPQMALCRCGGSANKPFCDGTHTRNGFISEKKPGRVPDRREQYAAGRLTVFDNRGICQHSALCTDELATVFKLKQNPWLDPAGAPQERIVEQVRKCPSGALSYAIDGVEHRDQERAPTVTVSKDGPYRITGGIRLTEDAWGEGSSLEHFALCRCGASKNKPFCDGSHWSLPFTDERN